MQLTLNELEARHKKFREEMDSRYPDWDTALILSLVNQYYFTGTIQKAILVIKREGGYSYNVRQSLERARMESPLSAINGMKSYQDVAGREGRDLGNTYLETDYLPYSAVGRLQKYFNMKSVNSLDTLVRTIRSVKSAYELYWLGQCGRRHQKVLEEVVPAVLTEGMNEAHFHGIMQEKMMLHGHQGISRFYDYQTEFPIGQVGFGDNLLFPSNFAGPSGCRGMSAAAPLAGHPERKLKKGDLVLADIGFGVEGYHTDKSQVYIFESKPSREMVEAHTECMEIAARIADALRPGAIPSEIYQDTMNSLSERFKPYFMTYGGMFAGFIGHGTGLNMDELPVIAKGFNDPLQENMVLALEPKIGLPGLGVVGVEDTYVVTPQGGRCLTGGSRDIMEIDGQNTLPPLPGGPRMFLN